MARAILYNKRKPLVELEIEKTKVTQIYRVIDEVCLPIVLQGHLTTDTINDWLSKRVIPEKRDGMTEIRAHFSGFANFNNMFSLSDQYWFQFNEDETWDKLNFFTNSYAEDFGKMFFSPWEVREENLSLSTPDITTNGVLRKRWIREENGESYLIKAGSKFYHQEPLSEVLASITLERLELLPFVKYELAVDGLRLCSKCKNFVNENTEFVPASYIYSKIPRKKDETVYEHLLLMCEKYGIANAQEYINNMITADKIIGNDDRHLGNFGFIRDVETGKIIGFAPLFDSGSAYWTKPGTAKKQRLFADQEKEALKDAMHRMNFDSVIEHQEMFRLIDMYPEIGKRKRIEIKQSILESEQELENCRLEIEQEKSHARHKNRSEPVR